MRIVVGVDGSDASRRALAWAAREAQAHHGRLTVCWTGPAPAASLPTGPGEPGSAHGTFDRIEDELLAVVAEAAPELDAELRLVPAVLGAKADDLVMLSRTANLLVLARPSERHPSRQSPAGITRRLVTQAPCPVLVVP